MNKNPIKFYQKMTAFALQISILQLFYVRAQCLG